ncbi:AMIN domain-containing protein, partial [Pseudanabaenaceae cyanobacterium LEGE 13415]|nr:AMIN domain-containing protein [Pseudanabaenaceae cyanobacterium LEGE 13415]
MISIQSHFAWATLSLCASILVQPESAISAERNSDGTAESISRISETERPNTNAKDLIVQANTPIQIINSDIRSTATGFTLNLQTANGEPLQAVTSESGNTLTIDIQNAQIQQAIDRRNPVLGIASIEIINQSANQVRITIVGIDGVPTGAIATTQTGFTIGVVAPEPEEEVVVTAQKRPEPAQDTPISLTVIERQTLEDAQINSLQGIAN